MDRSKCPNVERMPGKVSGALVIHGTRIPAGSGIDNAGDGFTAEQLVAEIYDGLPAEPARRVIAFAKAARREY